MDKHGCQTTHLQWSPRKRNKKKKEYNPKPGHETSENTLQEKLNKLRIKWNGHVVHRGNNMILHKSSKSEGSE
jgi:hypothetical protein